jgi:hypothetical protein
VELAPHLQPRRRPSHARQADFIDVSAWRHGTTVALERP